MSGLKIKLFGEFEVRRGERLIESREWSRQKTRSLLKLLLTQPGRAFSRDEIMEALWPDVSPQAAERSLRVTVSLLRKALEPDLERGSYSRYILRRRPGYLFDRDSDCEVDTWKFEELKNQAEAAQAGGKLDEAISAYRSALELLRGEFLAEDLYEDWAMEVRQDWQERHLGVLSNLSECLALKGRYTEAIDVCERALEMDGYREELHRRLMLYHYCAGEQALALQTFRRYLETLREELGVAPSPDLVRLKTQMETRDVPGVDALRRYPRPRRPLRFPYSLSRTHFVGRDREYALLAERLGEAMVGSGGAVAVGGEAGVGKTRLVEEFLGYARSRGARVFPGRCYERELGPPLEPVTEVLGPLTDQVSGDGSYQVLARRLIRESRGAKGIVLFMDDVQWADPTTLEFLAYVAWRVSSERVLVVMTYRREDAAGLSEWLDRLAERRAVTTVHLSRLSLGDTEEILSRMSSRAFGGLPSLADYLQRESEGNPFYLVEYLRWLIESGVVRIDSRRRISKLESRLRESALPSGVRALIQSRLSKMDQESRHLLELTAVIGRAFDLDLLRSSADRGHDAVLATVEALMTSGLIVETPAGAYYFSHDKFRQALYDGIGGVRRGTLHLRVAEALEENGGEAAELAHHYLQARAWRPALEKLVEAGQSAEEEYAWETALRSYTRALDVAEKLSDSRGERFELLAARDGVLERMGRREDRTATVKEMFDLARRLGDRARIAEAHMRRMGVLAAIPDPNGATESGRAAVVLFRELEDTAGESRAHREMGYVSWMKRDYDGALEANLRARELHRETGDRLGEAGDAGNLAQVYRSMGNEEEALRWTQEADRIYAGLGDETDEILRIDTMAAIHRHGAETTATIPLSLESLRVLTDFGIKDFFITQPNSRGTLYLGIGAPEEALEHFRAAAYFDRKR
jgi:DNA-binding SARP family transcriptional activator